MYNSQKHNYKFTKIKVTKLFTYDALIKTYIHKQQFSDYQRKSGAGVGR